MESCAASRARLCDPVAEVSAHWLISPQGTAEALVPESARAWHAGAGEWAGLSDINSHSIGIELQNRGDEPFAAPQIAALEGLLAAIMGRWSIPAHRVIGHSDMAPDRKGDPGARFDWRGLARAGLSVWPAPDAPAVPAGDFLHHARAFGYPVPDGTPHAAPAVLRAFRLRFRPWALHLPGPDAADAALAGDLARRFPVDARAARA